MSPKIDNHAAGIRVDGAEQCADRVVKTDHKNACAEHLQIFRHEPHPEFFARADDEKREQENDEIALQSEKIRDADKRGICRRAFPFLPGWRGITFRFHGSVVLVRSCSSSSLWRAPNFYPPCRGTN